MTPVPEKYAGRPNLWRAACELAKFKNPYKAADMLVSMAGTMQKEARV